MKIKNLLLLSLIVSSFAFTAIQRDNGTIKIIGKVSDFNDKPIKNAIIYIDSVRTEVTTNRRGIYKIRLSSKVKHIGAFEEKYGLLSTKYTGERKIDFVFRNPEDRVAANDMKIGVVYKKDISKTNSSINRGDNFKDFSSVAQLLNNRFPFVRAGNSSIVIGKGVNSFSGDPAPLIIIDNQRSNVRTLLTLPVIDIGDIRVIRRGSESAQYGSLGASNGVIIVKTKSEVN